MLVPRDNHLDQSWQIVFDLLHGGLRLTDLRKQLAAAANPALSARAQGLLAQLGSRDDAGNERALRAALHEAAESVAGSDFESFRDWLEGELAGIVITAHPTFALSAPARENVLDKIAAGINGARAHKGPSSNAAANAASAAADDVASATGTQRSLSTTAPAPAIDGVHRTEAPTLAEEFAAADAAIRNIRRALRRALHAAVDVAAERFPERYRELHPCLMTIATWVGFDLDGRTDIGWNLSLSCRYQLALDGLDELRSAWEHLGALGADAASSAVPVGEAFETVRQGIDALAESFAIGLEALGQESSASTRLGRLNRLALDRRIVKQDAIGAIDSALAALVRESLPDALARAIVVFRAEWEGLGLGLARLHFRLNSVQLHNAIRPDISMQGEPDRSSSRRRHLAAITKLLDEVEPVNVHYGSVARERTTAKRVFMLAAQFRKHFDERTPIRLLIAESDTPFTLLVALYYARLFGVEKHLEISPLFETADGLHHGDRVISELLDNPHFLAYLRAQRRFCIQLGFSDSGRYIGQPAASLAIERFKLRLVRLWRARGLESVQLVFFDTFGESIGRGAHPHGLNDRFLYTHSREVRHQLAALDAPYKHEVSFQGGDGYLWFASEATAFAVVTDLLRTRLDRAANAEDPLYTESGWALDFFLTLQSYQGRMTEQPGYLELIDALGRSLLYPSGSRPAKRQAGTGQSAGMTSIASLRAIPNNAILQQLGYLANSCAGLGVAADQSTETFLGVLAESDRLKRIVSLVRTARERSDITMLESYVQLMSAGYWLDRSGQSLDREWNRRLRRVSQVLESTFDQNHMTSFVRGLRQDAALLDDVLDERHVSGGWSSADSLTRLHVLRLALIQFIYLKAMEIPRFSPRTEFSLATLIERLLRLDVRETIDVLREIFPVSGQIDDSDVYAERDTYTKTGAAGYAAEHEQIFDPIVTAYGLCLEVSGLIALHLGAYG